MMELIMELAPSMAVTSLMTLAMAILASIFAAIPFFRTRKSDIPTLPVGSTWLQQKHAFRSNGPKLIEQGYLASKTGVFRVVYLNGTYLTIISPQHWLALCMKKEDEVSPAYREFFWSVHTGAAFEDQLLYKLVLAQMRTFDRNLPEIAESFAASLQDLGTHGEPQGYVPVNVAEAITRIFARASWKLIMRSQYDERIVNISLDYHRAHSAAKLKLRSCHPALCRIYPYFIADIRDLRRQLREATLLLSPVLSQARKQLAANESGDDNNIISWLLREVSPRQFANDDYLTNILLAYAISFVFSPTPIGTQVVHEMAFRPEYCGEMRREAEAVFTPGQQSYDKNTLRRLTKLDSFCKETHRHHPSAASNLTKKVHKTLTLPNGVVLPKGTIFEVAIQAANLHSPKVYDSAEWKGFRFHELRQLGDFGDKAARQYEWGACTREDIDFGYGMHACPGRAVGCNLLKIFLTLLLGKYELKPEEGVKESYGDVHIGQYIKPDFRRTVLMRRRARNCCGGDERCDMVVPTGTEQEEDGQLTGPATKRQLVGDPK